MTDFEKMLDILCHKSGDDEDLRPFQISVGATMDAQYIRLEGIEVGFVFDFEGGLIGAYNWKQ